MKALKSLVLILAFAGCLFISTPAKANSIWSNLLSGISLLDDVFIKLGYSVFGSNSVFNLARDLQVNPTVIEGLRQQGYTNGEIYYLLNLQRSTGMPLNRIVNLQVNDNIPLSFLPYYVTRQNPRIVFFPMQEQSIQYNRAYYVDVDSGKIKNSKIHFDRSYKHGAPDNNPGRGHGKDNDSGYDNNSGQGKGHGKSQEKHKGKN